MEPNVTVQQQIQELRALSTPALVARYESLFEKPPRVKNKEWLWKRCAWKLQEQAFGGLSGVARKRLEELIAEIDLPISERRRTVSGRLKDPAKPGMPPAGSIITRAWKGREVELKVVEGGFELEGVLHRSLSAAARVLTGSSWNGPLFWGLSSRKRKS